VNGGIDVMNLPGAAAREIAEEIPRGVADFLDRHAAPQWRVVLVPFEDVAEVTDPRRRQRLDRARGDGVDADILFPQIGGEIANGRLERRFGDPHHVVMRHPFLGPVIGEREQRAAARHQPLRALGERSERVATHQTRLGKIVGRRCQVAAGQLILVGEGDRMHEEIERAPFRLNRRESRVDSVWFGDVAVTEPQPANLLRQRFDPFLQRLALISESELGALPVASLCDTPGERAVVGDTQDQAALAAQETRGFRHDLPRCAADRESPYDTGQRTLQAAAVCRLSQPPARGNIAAAKVFVRVIWFTCKERRTRLSRLLVDRPIGDAVRRAGRESALGGFRQGIETAIPALRRYARALTRNAELADDLVQDTLVRALRSEHLFHGGDIRSWLYTILTNLNRNRLRALARRPALQAIDDNDAPEMAGPEAGARDIERALASLVEDQRTALLLVVLEGLTYREVAEVQGVPIGTVMSRLARARMQIKAYLDGERPSLRRIK